jgi:enolase
VGGATPRDRASKGGVVIEVKALSAYEILDSRAQPTISVVLELTSGVVGTSGVPSGASTGSQEAVELRDGDLMRYAGRGVLRAIEHINGEVARYLHGRDFAALADFDEALLKLDGTANKERIGANAIIGVSMAAARAFAETEGRSLWRSLTPTGVEPRLPVPHFNIINGGAHAPNALDFQEFMIAPLGARNMAEAIRAGAEIYRVLRGELQSRSLSVGLGDEGGFAPEIGSPEAVLELLVNAIESAGYEASRKGVMIALDPAANGFYRDGMYHIDGEKFSSDEMVERYSKMIERFPIWSLEDGLAENDRDGWVHLTDRLGEIVQLVGDDLLVTNPTIIAEAIEHKMGNAALIKPNQVGTVTETLEAMRVCRDAGWSQMVSHRSGETIDSFIADLAVAGGCGQIKSGAPARGERVAKYNRLLEIEATNALPYGRAE